MPAAKCGGCAKYLSPLGAATCSICKELFHRACVCLPSTGSVASSWCCTVCTRKGLRGVTGNTTPAAKRTIMESSESLGLDEKCDSDMLGSLHIFKEELRGELRIMFKEEFELVKKDFLDELLKLRKNIAQLQSDKDQLVTSYAALKERCDAIDAGMATFEQKSLGPSEAIEAVAQLRLELNDRDQLLLSNDVEISNLPESNNESLSHIVKVIGNTLGVKIDDRDIVSADRVGGGRVDATTAAGAVETGRRRPVVVRLARRDLRDELLRAARVRRGANTGDLGLSGSPRRFFINERLTKHNRMLFRRAREAGQRLGWKYVWARHGRILARHNADDKVSIIRNETDLLRVFGSD